MLGESWEEENTTGGRLQGKLSGGGGIWTASSRAGTGHGLKTEEDIRR